MYVHIQSPKNGIFGEFMVPWGRESDPSFHITFLTSPFVQEQTKGDRVDKKFRPHTISWIKMIFLFLVFETGPLSHVRFCHKEKRKEKREGAS